MIEYYALYDSATVVGLLKMDYDAKAPCLRIDRKWHEITDDEGDPAIVAFVEEDLDSTEVDESFIDVYDDAFDLGVSLVMHSSDL